MSQIFNYIVPIFNKEDVLGQTLESIEKCSGKNSKIFLIVDGCTDKSEQIVDEYINNSSRKVTKILMPNVHMLRSVNAGLGHVTEGFSIISQDDIILQDEHMEEKLVDVYNRVKNLGVISFRYGSNIRYTNLYETLRLKSLKPAIVECDLVKGPDDYANMPQGEYEQFYPRMSAINGPNCIPWSVFSQIGKLDERLAPYGYDDPEYCLRALQKGFINGLFPLKYLSEEEWGGTRRSKKFRKEAGRIHRRNRLYIYNKHEAFLRKYLKENKIYRGLETM